MTFLSSKATAFLPWPLGCLVLLNYFFGIYVVLRCVFVDLAAVSSLCFALWDFFRIGSC